MFFEEVFIVLIIPQVFFFCCGYACNMSNCWLEDVWCCYCMFRLAIGL